MKNTVIRFGNHWLMTDDTQTLIQWVTDRALASRHTRQWAERFSRAKCHGRADLFTPEEAQALADRERHDRLRAAYFYALESEVRRLAPDRDFYVPGLGCASYCFAVDPNFARGIPATTAAAEFVRTNKGRPWKALVTA